MYNHSYLDIFIYVFNIFLSYLPVSIILSWLPPISNNLFSILNYWVHELDFWSPFPEKDTLLSQVMGEKRAWSCLNLIHQNLLTPHGVLSEKWMRRWAKLRWRMRGRRGGSGNYGWYVKWTKKKTLYIKKKFKKACDDGFGQYSFQPKWVYSVYHF